MCVILSAKTPSRLEPVLADKEVLLTTLNIKAMAFSGIEDAEGGDKDDETETNVTQITNVSTSNLANSLKHRQAPKHLKSLLPKHFEVTYRVRISNFMLHVFSRWHPSLKLYL